MLGSESPEARIHRVAWLVAVVLGLLHAWVSRDFMYSDGLSYLDIADQLRRGAWANAVTGHWSPLYPAVIALATMIVRPSPAWEFPFVHVVNFANYLLALAAFTWLLVELTRLRDREDAGAQGAILPRDLLLVLGYTLFLWTALKNITIEVVTPDLLVAATTYCAAALLVRIRRGDGRRSTYLGLGVFLGLAYFAKSVMLFAAPVFLASAFLVDPHRAGIWRRAAVGTIAWLAVCLPWIALLSDSRDRLTAGDAGRDTYAWHVSGLPLAHWQGGPPGHGEPLHPTRRIHLDPPVYDFAEPLPGTYPVWYDPAYWFDGVKLAFSPRNQILRLRSEISGYFRLMYGFLVGWLVLFLASVQRSRDVRRVFAGYAFLLVPAVVPLVLHAFITGDPRHVGPFLPVIALALVLAPRLGPSLDPRMVFRAVTIALVLVLGFETAMDQARRAFATVREDHWATARALQRAGIRTGDQVARVGGYGPPYWARLARARVVAEIEAPHAEAFWSADAAVREEVLRKLAATSDVVVASDVPPWAPLSGWQKVGNSGFYIYEEQPETEALSR